MLLDLLAAWLLYPLALTLLCLGLGLLLERATGWRMPGALLLPAGFAALLATARLITESPSLAEAALPVIGALAIAGFALNVQRVRALRPDWWCVVAIAGVAVIFAAPVVFSGEPSFAGYLALPDTSQQLGLAHLYAHHGPDWMSLPAGATRITMSKYVTTSYPVAGQAALGVTAPLGVLDLAWLYQPLLTFGVLMGALAMWSLVAPVLGRGWQRAVVVFVGSQSALLMGNVLTGSIKEVLAVELLLITVALIMAAFTARRPARSLLPVGIAAAASLAALGPAAIPYLAAPGLTVIGVWGTQIARERRVTDAAWLAAGALVAMGLAYPVLKTLHTSVSTGTSLLVNLKEELGHLAGPLDTAQALGIWLSGDFRYRTTDAELPQTVLLWMAGIAALLALGWAIRRRHWGPLLVFLTFVPTSAYLLYRGTTYADSKVLIIASPACLMLAILGAVSLWSGRWRPLAAIASAALLIGVLWSSALAYHDVSLAPYARYSEMLDLNDRLAGRGPVFLGEYDEFAQYMLRDTGVFSPPDAPVDYRGAPYHPDALRDLKRRPSVKTPVDSDDLTQPYIQSFRHLILRRGPATSRPPANFELVSRERYYDVWRRTEAPHVLDHAPLGRDVLHVGATVTSRTASDWGRRARKLGGRIAYVVRPSRSIVLATRDPNRPARWIGFGNFPEALVSDGPSMIRRPVKIPRTGVYHAWVEGSFARRMAIYVDGKRLPLIPRGLNNPGSYASLGTVRLRRGVHNVLIRQRGGDLRPGTGGYRSSLRHLGPLFFAPAGDERYAVRTIDADDWRSLVGVDADWLEVVRG